MTMTLEPDERGKAKLTIRHTKDSDCRLNACDTCEVCGVYHDDPCDDCGQRGFHLPECCVIQLTRSNEVSDRDVDTGDLIEAIRDLRQDLDALKQTNAALNTERKRFMRERDEAVALLRRYRGGNFVRQSPKSIDDATDEFLVRITKRNI
jgi:hypothetical protein